MSCCVIWTFSFEKSTGMVLPQFAIWRHIGILIPSPAYLRDCVGSSYRFKQWLIANAALSHCLYKQYVVGTNLSECISIENTIKHVSTRCQPFCVGLNVPTQNFVLMHPDSTSLFISYSVIWTFSFEKSTVILKVVPRSLLYAAVLPSPAYMRVCMGSS